METFANNAVGNLNASILIGATSLVLQAGQGALFPATGNFRIVIGTEIIIVGARSGDTLSSLTRGAEGTAAAAHNSADVVTHELTAGALTPLGAALDAWTAYTPTWTSAGTAPVLGNGTLAGRYVQIGKTVHVMVAMTAGTTTTFGSANAWTISLPVTAQSGNVLLLARATDTGINNYQGTAFGVTTTTVGMYTVNAASGTVGAWTNVLPFAWGSTDLFVISGTYEAA